MQLFVEKALTFYKKGRFAVRDIAKTLNYFKAAAQYKGTAEYLSPLSAAAFLSGGDKKDDRYLNPFCANPPPIAGLKKLWNKKRLTYDELADISRVLQGIKIGGLFDKEYMNDPEYAAQKQRLLDLRSVNFISADAFYPCCKELSALSNLLKGKKGEPSWYSFFKEKVAEDSPFFQEYDAFVTPRNADKKYTIPVEKDRDGNDSSLSLISPDDVEALLKLEDEHHSYTKCNEILEHLKALICKKSGGEVKNLTDKYNLLKLLHSFRYEASRKSKSAIFRYVLLLIETGTVKIEGEQFRSAIEFFEILPKFLAKEDLMKYIRTLEPASYSLSDVFDDLQREPDSLLHHFISGVDIGNNKSGVNATEFDDQWAKLMPHEPDAKKPMPNRSQTEAVKNAILSRMSIIQGPPGTGKTDTILNMASMIYACGKTAAIVSSNNSAVDNVMERIGGTILEHKFAPLGNKQKRIAFGSDYYSKDGKALKNSTDFLKEFPIVSSTIHSLSKLFTDAKDSVFDYVIIDEASQSDIILGVTAMIHAKNLILVGDDNQLPPVFIDDEKLVLAELRKGEDIPPHLQLDRSDYSILAACSEVFEKARAAKLFLEEHYRCHPSIIDFCSRYVYTDEDKTLKIKSRGRREDCRIAVRWYRGDYAESCRKIGSNDSGNSKRNMRQVKIFMEEEWVGLLDILERKQDVSVAIMAPYVGQIEAIGRAIREAIKTSGIQNLEIGTKMESGEEKGNESLNCHTLTIHKAQGREFDIVYILPVDDGNYEWPFSQKKRLVNVAVSRAKEELRIITSINMMSEKACKALKAEYYPVQEHNETKAKDELFFQKLIDYTLEWGDKPINAVYQTKDGYAIGRMFGFIPTQMPASIFDDIFRKGDFIQHSAPELIFKEKSEEIIEEYKQYGFEQMRTNLLLRECFSDEQIHKDFHFDFAFFRHGKLRLAVEIDGEPHRSQIYDGKVLNYESSDYIKEKIVQMKGGSILHFGDEILPLSASQEFYFLRIPNDGKTCDEMGKIKDILNMFTEEEM